MQHALVFLFIFSVLMKCLFKYQWSPSTSFLISITLGGCVLPSHTFLSLGPINYWLFDWKTTVVLLYSCIFFLRQNMPIHLCLMAHHWEQKTSQGNSIIYPVPSHTFTEIMRQPITLCGARNASMITRLIIKKFGNIFPKARSSIFWTQHVFILYVTGN